MANSQPSRQTSARFAFVALLALSFLFAQSLQTAAHANPKKGKKVDYGRVYLTVAGPESPDDKVVLLDSVEKKKEGPARESHFYDVAEVYFDGAYAGPATRSRRTFESVTPGPHTFEVIFQGGNRWVREIVVEAGRIYCLGVAYKPAPPIEKVEYCKPFGQVSVSTQPKFKKGEPVTFKATVARYSGENEPVYTWTVSAGTIVRGAGASEIEVDTAGVETDFTATVSVDEGSGRPLPPGSTLRCHAEANATTTPEPEDVVFDAYSGIAFDDVKARLDNFVIEARSVPQSTAYVIYYSGAGCRGGQRTSLGDLSVDYMVNTRGFDRSRVKLIDGGQSSMDWVELWVKPIGAATPTPRPDFPSSGDPGAPAVSKTNKQYPCVKSPLDAPRQERARH
ncbi:MAG TPA: hypothetical protein VGC87_04470 [Pyrinomonadaceae bacterium]|jgi:hypothetical protein